MATSLFGYSGPQAVAAPTQERGPAYGLPRSGLPESGGDPGLWYDNSKPWNASNPLAGVKPLTGLQYVPAREYMARNAGGDMEMFTDPAYVLSSNGTRLPATQNADGTISFSDRYDDPAGKSSKDKLDASYTMDPKTGTAVPTAAVHAYQASDWVSNGQPIATVVAMMAAAYLGGSALAGAGTGGGTAVGAGTATTGAAAEGGAATGAVTGGAAATGGGAAEGLGAGALEGAAGTGGGAGFTGAAAGAPELGYAGGEGIVGGSGAGFGSGAGLDAAETAAMGSGGAGLTASSLASGASNASQLGSLLSGGVGTSLAGVAAGALTHGSSNVNTPDYKGAAQDQGASGRVDQSNPWGNLTYTQNGVDSHGNPVYKQNVTLNAADQANLDSARSGQSAALFGLNNSISGYDDAIKRLPGLYGDAGTQEGLANQARDAMYHQQTALLDPQYQEQQRQLQSQLANQGVVQGSQAYNTAMDSYARQRDYAYGNARDSSINQGNTYANQLFGQNLQAHNTGMSDLSTQQNQYLNTANGLSNTVKQPTFNATSAPTNYLGAAVAQGQGNLNQYNATTGANNSTQNGLYSLGGAILSNPSWTNAIGNYFSTGGG